MTDLITKLENAEKGSRELSSEVLVACGWTYDEKRPAGAGHTGWYLPNGGALFTLHTHLFFAPDPTRNLQDAVNLVPERDGTNKAAFLHGVMFQLHIGDIPDEKLAIFVCIALLKAKAD